MATKLKQVRKIYHCNSVTNVQGKLLLTDDLWHPHFPEHSPWRRRIVIGSGRGTDIIWLDTK